MLSDIPASIDDRVLVDFRTADDAGVFRWEGGPALVQTVDFFTPIVDDPYIYGQIAAANAVSDVYAMGGRPLTALAIAAMPKDGLEPGTIREIFRGGFDKLREAGVALLGGHTVQDPEIKFGYAVTGAIDPARILTNAAAQPGDVLFLTKPIGTGIVGTAIKFGRAPATVLDEAVASMRRLNRAAAEAVQRLPRAAIHACTDITGFGLAGHATEMARASGVTIGIALARVPTFAGVSGLAARNKPGGLATNAAHFAPGVRVAHASESIADLLGEGGTGRVGPGAGVVGRAQPGDAPRIDDAREPASASLDHWWPLYDPQTSGGLLIAAASDAAGDVEAALTAAGVTPARIGRAIARISGVQILVWP